MYMFSLILLKAAILTCRTPREQGSISQLYQLRVKVPKSHLCDSTSPHKASLKTANVLLNEQIHAVGFCTIHCCMHWLQGTEDPKYGRSIHS